MYYIITRNSIRGFHCWPGAPDRLKFLRHKHRHVFEITCVIPVTHADRQREIIETEIEIDNYLTARYGNGHMELGAMSCEMLAKELADKFGCQSVTVLEDGYGGARYVNAGQ